jgi:hypothetical protein
MTRPLKPGPVRVKEESVFVGGEKVACKRTTTGPRLSRPGKATITVVFWTAVLVVVTVVRTASGGGTGDVEAGICGASVILVSFTVTEINVAVVWMNV